MCLTTQAFGVFLSIITLNNVSVGDGVVTIHTPQTDVIWIAYGDQWCTGKPGGLDVQAAVRLIPEVG